MQPNSNDLNSPSGNGSGYLRSGSELRLLILGQPKLLVFRAILGLPITVSSVLRLVYLVAAREGPDE